MKQRLKILIIEDDKYISGFTAVSLRKEGHEVEIAESVSEGLFLFSGFQPNLILLDLGLPDEDGMTLLKEVRSHSQVPIIIVSARDQEKEKIRALDNGADDYITKPFYMGELLARIRVFERKLEKDNENEKNSIFQFNQLLVDEEKRRVFNGATEIHLTPIEYKLLLLLIHNRGKVLTHNYILRHVWGYENESDTKTVRVFMVNLRRKIENDSSKPQLILTEVGVGYRFTDES